MQKQIAIGFFTVFLMVSLFGCNSNNTSDATSPNRPQPNMNNRSANSGNVNSMNSSDSTNTKESTMTADTEFLTKAAQGGMSEVALGKLAATKAQNPEVKKFGQKMVDDHSKANDELKALAAKKNFTLPTEVNSEQKSLMDKLNGLSGADFDKEYVKAMVDDHEEDVEEFKKQSESGKDADVKGWAAKTLPTLQTHLDMIKGIQSKMK
jgi:putative membrane protein